MEWGEILSSTEIVAAKGFPKDEIRHVTNNSRQVKEGSLFVAITGLKADGHNFISDAVSKNAAAIVIEDSRFTSDEYPWVLVHNTRKALADLSNAVYGFPSRRLNVIGVTGTNGKTTTTNLIATVLEDAGHKTGLIGTIHNRIGAEISPVNHTTPEAHELQELLLAFADRGASYAVMEVSSHALVLHRVRGTEFDIAVFTNLTQDHLDFHENMEKYLEAKSRLFSELGIKNTKSRRKFAIINNDDPYAGALTDMSTVPVITYGIKNDADIKAENIQYKLQGVYFILRYTNKDFLVQLKMTGLFNVYNALAAIAVGLIEGIPAENLIASLERVNGIPGRFEKVEVGQDFTVIVDYSHTPDSLENCLRTARQLTEGRVITVFGCGGDRDRTKRPIMGEKAGRLSDFCIVTSDNPRSENPQAIIDEIVPGLKKTAKPGSYVEIADRREAIYFAIGEARPQDVVIIAGKGHETYQIIGTQIIPFDDRQVASEALRKR